MNNKRIYVICPSPDKSGGPELAHQLVYEINKLGGNAQIAYYRISGEKIFINEAFKKYVSTFVELNKVEDSPSSIIVALENHPEFLTRFKQSKKFIWWMSVDNYFPTHNLFYLLKKCPTKQICKTLFRKAFHFSKLKLDDSITHLYQSEYAHSFLKSLGISNFFRLSDYLNSNYLNDDFADTVRQNKVLYNPKKGLAFTKKLMKFAPDIQWIPLQNMTTEQVKETLLHSKVYIDFGNHPGKDRFPREAAMCGCCVITGKRGSAKFFEDVPIADEFKFDESRKTIPLIISKIRECLDNYEIESPKFNGYREFIKGEYQTFQDDVKKIFTSFK